MCRLNVWVLQGNYQSAASLFKYGHRMLWEISGRQKPNGIYQADIEASADVLDLMEQVVGFFTALAAQVTM